MPPKSSSENLLRSQWIDAIRKHQHFDENRTNFNVCIRHFRASDLFLRGKEKFLKLNAKPMIFNEAINTSSTKASVDDVNNENTASYDKNECEKKCHLLQAKVTEMEKQLFNLKVQHDVEIQKLKINAKNSRQAQSNRLKETKKQLSKQTSKVLRMEDLVKELHEKQYTYFTGRCKISNREFLFQIFRYFRHFSA